MSHHHHRHHFRARDVRLYNPVKRERDQDELDAMKAQGSFFVRLCVKLFCAIIIIGGCAALFYSGKFLGEMSACPIH